MTVYRFVHDGRLPAMRVGKSLRVHRDDLEAFLRDQPDYRDERLADRVRPEPSRSPDTITGQAASKNHHIATVVHSVKVRRLRGDALWCGYRERLPGPTAAREVRLRGPCWTSRRRPGGDDQLSYRVGAGSLNTLGNGKSLQPRVHVRSQPASGRGVVFGRSQLPIPGRQAGES
jgi:hypothetical protein